MKLFEISTGAAGCYAWAKDEYEAIRTCAVVNGPGTYHVVREVFEANDPPGCSRLENEGMGDFFYGPSFSRSETA